MTGASKYQETARPRGTYGREREVAEVALSEASTPANYRVQAILEADMYFRIHLHADENIPTKP